MMARSREYNVLRVILTLFVCLLPVLGSAFDEKAVIYASATVLLTACGVAVHKVGAFPLTKTAVFLFALCAYSYLEILWVSDKSSQFAFATLVFTAGLAVVLVCILRDVTGFDVKNTGARIVYASSICYCVAAVLSQIFVESKFFGCNMDMGNCSPTAAAFIALAGMMSAFWLFSGKKKTPSFIAGTLLMVYVFIMTKSLCALMCAGIIAFFYTMRIKKKRAEAFFSLLATAVLAVLNVFYAVYAVLSGKTVFNATMRATVKLLGLGYGGYDAYSAVFDGAYKTVPVTIDTIFEVYGALGLLVAVGAIFAVGTRFYKKRSVKNLFILLAVSAMLVTSHSSLVFMLPLTALFFGDEEEAKYVKIHPLVPIVCVIPICFNISFILGRCLYPFAKNASDMARFDEAASIYMTAGKCEIFGSEAYEKAYDALDESYRENGEDNLFLQEECLEKAVEFNKDNYFYKRLMADVYMKEKRYDDALAVWEDIMLKNDREYLYPLYATAVCHIMEHGGVNLSQAEELYCTIEIYAKKCEDEKIKTNVNDILTKAQKFYIIAREGSENAGDMYSFDTYVATEEVSTDTGV